MAAHLLTMEADVRLAQEVAIERACRMVEKAAKRAIGKYLPGYNWEQLAQATQKERVRLGFTRNKPLLRTGDLKDSISHYTEREGNEVVGYVGSPLTVALYQEMGHGAHSAEAVSVGLTDGAGTGDCRNDGTARGGGSDAGRPELPCERGFNLQLNYIGEAFGNPDRRRQAGRAL